MADAVEFCCPMRKKFLVGIVAVDISVPDPLDLADFILDWGGEGKPILIAMRFCPFCGKDGKDQFLRYIPPIVGS